MIGSGARERAALPVKTPIGHTSATGLAADNVADDKELQTTYLLHEGWMPGEPSRCQDHLSEFQRTSENKETTGYSYWCARSVRGGLRATCVTGSQQMSR